MEKMLDERYKIDELADAAGGYFAMPPGYNRVSALHLPRKREYVSASRKKFTSGWFLFRGVL